MVRCQNYQIRMPLKEVLSEGAKSLLTRSCFGSNWIKSVEFIVRYDFYLSF